MMADRSPYIELASVEEYMALSQVPMLDKQIVSEQSRYWVPREGYRDVYSHRIGNHQYFRIGETVLHVNGDDFINHLEEIRPYLEEIFEPNRVD